ncbi:YeiH family protein [Nocardioides daejeonensis]|uniref:YeiH family protein n=1 Tax=Nocardioides daejeonensis TaxID=1046556 RepID=UPI0013A58ED0|nr:putative sulfate exporter family transporter [Nocardioides daejeonensis]
MPLPTRSHQVSRAHGALLAAGGLALALGLAVPLVSPLLIAMALGAAAVNISAARRLIPADPEAATKLLLRWGVVLLGFRLEASDLAEVGLRGVTVILLVVAVTYFASCAIGDRMGMDRGLVTMIAAGCAVCGAAAIAAVESGIRRRTEDVALAVALITLFGTGTLLAVPVLAQTLGLGDLQTAVWIGASIHEVAQVVAASAIAGGVAAAVAMSVKLGRVALLAPIYALAGARFRTRGVETAVAARQQLVPWFVVGFLLAAAIRTAGLLPQASVAPLNAVATVLLAAAMFGLGLGLDLRKLLPLNLRALALASVATFIAVSVSLVATTVLITG